MRMHSSLPKIASRAKALLATLAMTGTSAVIAAEGADTEALSRDYVYYDPIYTLSAEGQEWWRARGDADADHALAMERAAASREAAALAVP